MRRRRVLLLHDPVHRIHVYVVTCLAQFLEQHCNIDVSLDIRDIPHTENKVRIALCFAYYYFASQYNCWALIENFTIECRLPRDVEFEYMLGTSVDTFESSPRFLDTIINNIIYINTAQLHMQHYISPVSKIPTK